MKFSTRHKQSYCPSLLAGACALALVCFSCAKEQTLVIEDPSEPDPVVETVRVCMEPSGEGTATKVDIASASGAATWTEGDRIAYCISNGGSSQYKVSMVSVSNGVISVSLPSGYSRANYAIYPATAAGTDYTSPTVVYSTSYDVAGKTSETYSPAPMVAVNAPYADLAFYHVGGLLRINLSGILPGTKTISFTFEGMPNMTGTYAVTGGGTNAATVTLRSGTGNVVSFTNGGTDFAEEVVLNIPLPAVNYSSLTGLTVTAKDSGNTAIISSTKPLTWSAIARAQGKLTDYVTPFYFSVSSSKRVLFAPGNLQAVIGSYNNSTRIATASSWKFAENQYSFIGNAPGNTSFNVGTTVDLFGWEGETATQNTYGLFGLSGNIPTYTGNSTTDALKEDWGAIPAVVSALGDGWFTLSAAEWDYLFTGREEASSKYGHCRIKTGATTYSTGVLLLPDRWSAPAGFSFTPGTGAYTRSTFDATASTGTANAWCDVEAAGAVFLPAAGARNGLTVINSSSGCYWSSSPSSSAAATAISLNFTITSTLNTQNQQARSQGCAVRLAREL